MKGRWRDVADQLVGALVVVVVLAWVAYVWERTTGFTWATRKVPGRYSDAAHLTQTLRTAIGMTAVILPAAAVYFALRRSRR
jgi:hypothetical protein